MVEIVKQNYHNNIKIFNKIKNELLRLLNKRFIIDHVGSTAIPNMYGKNIIDVLIGVNSKDEVKEVTDILTNNGYYLGKQGNSKYQFLASTSDETKSGDVHIHIAIINEPRYNNFLLLKTFLLDNPTIAKEYSNHKKYIVKKYGNNRKKYRQIKISYVDDLIKKAREYFFNNLPSNIILIRHGENIINDKLNNDLLPLSKKGKKQALDAKVDLNNQFDVIISSPSLRARETANIIGNNMKYNCDFRLLEKGYGNKKHDGKETIEDATMRFKGFLKDLKIYKNKKVLVVTHGSLIKLAENILEERNIKRKKVNNCTIINYRKDEMEGGYYVLFRRI